MRITKFLLGVLIGPALLLTGATPPTLNLPATVVGTQTYSYTTPTIYNFAVSSVSSSGVFSPGTSYSAFCSFPSGIVPGGGTNPNGTVTPPEDPHNPSGSATYSPISSYSVTTPGNNSGYPGFTYNAATQTFTTTSLTLAQEWSAVNWILNTPKGVSGENPTPTDTQAAIWQLLHPDIQFGFVTTTTTPGSALTPASAMLYNDALANGLSFIPAGGQVVAVLMLPTTPGGSAPYQGLFIPVPIPAGSCAIPAAYATGLNLGTDASYIFIDTGNTKLGWNAYQLNGNVLFGQGLTVQLSGGNNGGLGAGFKVYDDSTTNISGSLQNPLTFASVPTSQTAAAAATAKSVSNYANGLAATQAFNSINNNMTINGDGGLNVIDVGSIQNANLTIHGSASDYFIFNVSNGIQTNQVITLTGGVTASNILWNLTGSGNVLQTSGGNVLVGTFLATNGGQFQFSELQLTGALINTGGNVQLVSGNHTLTQAGFCH